MTNIVFYYPSKRIGGAQLLFVRLAMRLQNQKGLKVTVADYEDGFLMRQFSENPKVQLLNVNGPLNLNEERTIIVTPLSNITGVKQIFRSSYNNVRFLFWSIHPNNLEYAIRSRGRRFFFNADNAADYIIDMSRKSQIVYMDSANYRSASKLINREFPHTFLPIPIEISQWTITQPRKIESVLNIGWLGRISNDKIYSIIKIIDEIADCQNNGSSLQIHFHIIGDGEETPRMNSYLAKSGIASSFVGVLTGADLDNYISENIDLGVAMGTSAMEFAVRRVPVFLIDYSYKRFPKNFRYNWLFETEGFSLGDDVSKQGRRNHTFGQIVESVISNNDLGLRAFEYVFKNHGIDSVAQSLFTLCAEVIKKDKNVLIQFVDAANPLAFRIFLKCYLFSISLYRYLRKVVQKRRRDI